MHDTIPNNSHDDTCDIKCKEEIITKREIRKTDIVWFTVFYLLMMHTIGLYGLITFNYFENLRTTLWLLILYNLGCIGVTAGAHRFWSHRSYSANLPLRLILFVCYCSSGGVSIFSWVRIHRVHHKYVDTDLDPHNSRRGFFFCHIGWILRRLRPEIIQKLRETDMRDILADPLIAFHKKYVTLVNLIFSYVLPTLIPVYFWGETWNRSFISQVARVMLVLHASFSINSFAHMWGTKPYNKNIRPTENMSVSVVCSGEGFHNYHHTFPWDYRAAEFNWYIFNHSSFFIDMFAKIGWAYNLKKPSPELVKRVAADKGDGSRAKWDEIPMCDSSAKD
ncbi:PREDICTED: acyl-CoA Delta(11) desaturase-like isoform X2 [Acromyrmex echinatior]|uniref:acyl-CoA Delta(11) desaturase-like isoform X2 n=1 Tax=Acromyrmex echinatior TaxID=103372 RepID=UPI000580D09A|nr:PREDICTED: acyl-CoA Delta(11) desaturase-like isoform X2 [Acromyrmex echinatior]